MNLLKPDFFELRLRKNGCVAPPCVWTQNFKCIENDIGSLSCSKIVIFWRSYIKNKHVLYVTAILIPILVFSREILRRDVNIVVTNPIFDRNRFSYDHQGLFELIQTSGRLPSKLVRYITIHKYKNKLVIQKYHFKNKLS